MHYFGWWWWWWWLELSGYNLEQQTIFICIIQAKEISARGRKLVSGFESEQAHSLLCEATAAI